MNEPGFRMKVVGRRNTDSFSWDELRRLTLTAEVLRGTSKLVPRGVYRFHTFEEADKWMIEMIARTHALHGPKMSPLSPAR
jgi:hypothetical protein